MKLSDLAKAVPIEVVRDGQFESTGLTYYATPALLAALYDPRFLRECLENSHLACLITTTELAARLPSSIATATCDDPLSAFLAAHRYLLAETSFYGDDVETVIHPKALIDPVAFIAPNNVRIGSGCVIEGGAKIMPGSTIGRNSAIRAGAVIGAEGFDPKPSGDGYVILPHSGTVVIGAGVEIQSNCVVCRGAYSATTRIGDGAVVSSLVNISHNVSIGVGCRVGAGACILGSSRIERKVWIGPNSTIANRIRIGEGARVSLGSVVVRDVAAGETVSGNFAIPHAELLNQYRRLRSRRGKNSS